MTFKHVKFEDSPIMRSLEKVAREKGLVKDEPIAKTASTPTIDLVPSGNLMSNVLKLCAGLRASGFDKYASELELAYLNYKRANTLYETSKEKGEDLVDEAHPKGSHKLEGVDGDAVVETILDNHLKMVEMINKKPTGKLASSKNILGAVKKVFAQNMSREEIEAYVLKYIVDRAWGIRNQYAFAAYQEAVPHLSAKNSSLGLIDTDLIDMQKAMNSVDEVIKKMSPNVPTVALLKQLNWAYTNCISETDIENDRVKNSVVAKFKNAITATNLLIQQLQSFESNPNVLPEGIAPAVQESKVVTIPEVTNVADPIVGKGAALIGRIKGYQTIRNVAKNPAAFKWTNDQIAEIQDVMTRWNKADDAGQAEQVRANFQAEMAEKEKEVNDFYAKVTGQKG